MKHLTALWTAVLFGLLTTAYGQTAGNIYQATLGESGQRTVEVSTQQLRGILADMSAVVLVDVREAEDFRSGSLPNARNVPRSGVLEGKDLGDVKRAKDDGRLPMQDHNARLIVIGRDVAEARYVAEALVREAFQNVAYFHGSFQDAQAALKP